jgi:NADPH2:quinone reductase
MFTRSMFQTQDMIKQHELLNEVSKRLNNGALISSLNTVLGKTNPENIREAHRLLEAGHTIGKIVLSGFD